MMTTTFTMSVDGGEPFEYESRHSVYSLAVMEAFGRLGLPYPCDVAIWVPELVESGHGEKMTFSIEAEPNWLWPCVATTSEIP